MYKIFIAFAVVASFALGFLGVLPTFDLNTFFILMVAVLVASYLMSLFESWVPLKELAWTFVCGAMYSFGIASLGDNLLSSLCLTGLVLVLCVLFEKEKLKPARLFTVVPE